jgi:subtilisin family serine protease
MRLLRWGRGGIALAALLLAASPGGGAATQPGRASVPPAKRPPPSVPGQLIVGFKHGVTRARESSALAAAGARVKIRMPDIGAILATAPGRRDAAIARLRRDPTIRYAEPNLLLHASDARLVPNDPGFQNLWGLDNFGQTVNFVPGTPDADIDAPEAWAVTTGSPDVTVAVVDTGIDYTHPDLAANIWLNPGENCPGCRNDGIDNDHNGYVDDWRGWDFVNNDNDPMDDHGHGTHVAGTIGAVGDNGIGVAGVNWHVKLMPLKFLDATGSGTTADAIRAVLYAADEGAVATNNSYGGDGYSQAFADAIAYADSRGSLFVAAAGNSSANTDSSPNYPSSYDLPNVISVAATNSSDGLAWFSNYGRRSVDLGAPGDNVYSTVPGASYAFESGTSMATPHVTGAAALVKSRFPNATDVGIKALLLRSVDPLSSLTNRTTTGGRLNVNDAVECAGAPQAWLEAPTPGFVAAVGSSIPITAIGAVCGDPAGVSVQATVNGDPVALTSRGDGLYTGTYVPSAPGQLTVSFSASAGGLTDTATASGSVPTPIVPGGDPVTVTTTVPGQDAVLAFAGAGSQRVSLAVTGVTIGNSICCSTKVSILNPDGSALVPPTYVGTSGGFLDTRSLPTNGTYTVVVDPQGTATGSATLTLYDVPADASGSIVPGASPVTATTTVPGQNVQLSFSGSTGRRVSLSLSGVTFGSSTCCSTKVSILNPDGSALVSPTYVGTSGAFIDTRTLPANGTYTAVVDPQGAATGSATLTLYDVPPDAAGSIFPGDGPVTATTTVPGQNAQLSFDGVSGQRVSLAVGPSCCYLKVSILGPGGTTLMPSTYLGTSGFVDTRTLPANGTYIIVIDPQGAATGNTTLSLYDVPADASGTIVPGGASATVTTRVPGQNAQLSFSGSAGRRVSLKVNASCCSLKVSVLNPDGSTLVPASYAGSGTFLDTRTLPASGAYTIVVDPQGAATGSVTMTLYDVPPDVTAPIVVGGPSVTVSTTVPGQNAQLSFSGLAGQTVNLQASRVTILISRVSILAPDGQAVVPPTLVFTSGRTFTTSLPATGTYTIVVDPDSANVGSMTLTLT